MDHKLGFYFNIFWKSKCKNGCPCEFWECLSGSTTQTTITTQHSSTETTTETSTTTATTSSTSTSTVTVETTKSTTSQPPDGSCELIQTEELDILEDTLIYKIDKYPKYYHFEVDFKVNNFGYSYSQNIFHLSNENGNSIDCHNGKAGRHPSLFIYADYEGNFQRTLVSFCKDTTKIN